MRSFFYFVVLAVGALVAPSEAQASFAFWQANPAAPTQSLGQQAYIKPSTNVFPVNTNVSVSGQFGFSVSLDADTLVVGASGDDSQFNNKGAVHVFIRSESVWSHQAYITSAPMDGDYFGESVSVHGDTLAIGARWEDSNATGIGGLETDNSLTDSGAVYVFTRSGAVWSQQAYIKASNTGNNDAFGWSVSLSGDTLAVGAYQEDSNATGIDGLQTDNSASDSGAVYVFTRSGAVWSQQAYIKASNTGAGDVFGWSVSLSGDTLAVGARAETSNATGIGGNEADNSETNAGAVYVFTRVGSVWSQQAYIKASNTNSWDRFGSSVSVSGETLAVGAYSEASNGTGVNSATQGNNGANNSGAVYVFTRSGSTWSQQAYIKASNTAAADYFGWSVSVSGDTLAVGAAYEDSNATGIDGNQANNSSTDSGAVYVFTRTGGVWSQQAYVKASNTESNDSFGYSVSVSNDTLAVSALYEDSNANGINGDQSDNSLNDSGAVYAFTRSGSTWSQQAYVKASNNTVANPYYGAYNFGHSVSLSGNSLAVGAYQEDSNANGINGNQADNSLTDSGAVYVFTRSGAVWSQQAYIKASNTGANDKFGYSVSIEGDTLSVGAHLEDSSATGIDGAQGGGSANSGAVYVFTRSGSTWSQQAYVKASNTGTVFSFGYSVSLSGESMAVSAPYEQSNATGINGAQTNSGAVNSGAVYVFTRTGSVWSQQAYIKASNTEAHDEFGNSVSLSGDTLAVGAFNEDSMATGINGVQTGGATNSGAAYVFTRTGGVWSQQAYVKASNTNTGDTFGTSVSVSGDTLAVGAPFEDSDGTGVNSATQSNNTAGESGAVYVFTRSGSTWSQQAYIKASNTQTSDEFGNSVSLSGDTLAVGAHLEDSGATGINGSQAGGSANSGAVYVFKRTDSVWSQHAYIKASNTGNGDKFGTSISLSGTTLAVGAIQEDSDASGINGNQSNDSSSNSGAVYVFGGI